jgi:DNA replication protein DnaC
MRSLRRDKAEARTPLQDRQDKLIALRLQSLAAPLGTLMEHAAPHPLDLLTPLSRRAAMALAQRFPHAMALRGRPSKLADTRTLAQFDVSHPKASQEPKPRLLNRRTRDFARAHLAVRLMGPPGAGQTCLAPCRASAACHATIQGLFPTAIEMSNQLMAAAADRSLLKKRQYDQAPALLGGDELGSGSLGHQGAHLGVQVLRGRQQRQATVRTTHGPVAAWGTGFESPPVATAIADRLGDNAAVLLVGGSSSRRPLTEAAHGRPTSTGAPQGHTPRP